MENKIYKTHPIVILPTENKSSIFILDDDLHYSGSLKVKYSKCVITNTLPQHIYILSNEKIRTGDNIYWKIGDEEFIGKACKGTTYDKETKKIIYTTDVSLKIALIPESFLIIYIKAFNVGKPITEIELLYGLFIKSNKPLEPNVDNDLFRNFIYSHHLTAKWEQYLKDIEHQQPIYQKYNDCKFYITGLDTSMNCIFCGKPKSQH